jgi:quinoprotein glucose dehydrogenase
VGGSNSSAAPGFTGLQLTCNGIIRFAVKQMSRKYAIIACCFAAVIGIGYCLCLRVFNTTRYIRLQLSETAKGSFILDTYHALHRRIYGLLHGANNADTIEENKVTYSIFDASLSLKQLDEENERSALPEYMLIPGLNESFKGETYPSSIDFGTWHRSHGDNYSSKYSVLDQINKHNVQDLGLAWIYHFGEEGREKTVETNPIFADGKVFSTSSAGSLVAIDAVTGVEKWRTKLIHNPARRGLLWWAGNSQHAPELFVPSDSGVYAVNPDNGTIIESFGDSGRVGGASLVAPVVDEDRLIIATTAPSVEAYNVGSGILLWKTELLKSGASITQHIELPSQEYRLEGGVPWAGISLDENRERVYVSTGNARPTMYGVTRPGPNQFSSSILSINTLTGKIEWSFQEVAHDLWDLDVPSPPNLLTISRAGRPIDVVAAVTKLGNTLLLERDTGKPVFDYRLRRAPVSEVPGEMTWPYQPDLEIPEPFTKKTFEPSDVTDLSTAQTTAVTKKLRNARFGFFAPPAINSKVAVYGVHGGAEWPGAAVDQETGILYVPSNQFPWIFRLHYTDSLANPIRSIDEVGDRLYQSKCASCHGVNREGYYELEFSGDRAYPSLIGISASENVESPELFWESHVGVVEPGSIAAVEIKAIGEYLRHADHISDDRRSLKITFAWSLLRDNEGYPGSKPPWGLITAIDLNSGKEVWQVPFGEYPELTKRGIPITGQTNFGGVMVTKGGLVFGTGTVDEKVRAYDSATGDQLWDYDLPAAGSAPPSTYEIAGTQYIVVVATGGWYAGFKGRSDTIVAFKLKGPASKKSN